MSLTDTTHLRDLFDKTIFKNDKDRSGSSGLLHDDGFYCILCKAILVVTLVVCLSAVTKQPAKGAQGCPRAPFAKQTYCLVPDFFLTGMLKVCSARSIMVE